MLPETKKENKITVSEKKPKVNSYYLVLSGKFKTAKLVALCILVAFLLTVVVLFRDEITVENLRYLFKDFEIGDNVTVGSGDEIMYDADMQVKLAMYKGDLVIAGSTYFHLTDLQGNKRLNEDSVFSNPVVMTSDKYLLVYGLSEYTYTVYNTFSKLHTETFDYPITGAAVSNKGLYAIVTRTAEYRSVVYLYNENFERIGAVYKDKYVTDVEFNNDGSELIIVSLFSSNGNLCTEIVNYVPFSEKTSASVVVENSMAIETAYNKNNGYSVIYDNKIEFYDSEFVLRKTYNYPSGLVPITTEIDKNYTMITYSENIVGNDIKVLVFDTSGELVLSADAEGQPKKIRADKDNLYLLLNGKVCVIKISDGSIKYYETEKNALDLLYIDDKTVFVCYSDHTSKVVLE